MSRGWYAVVYISIFISFSCKKREEAVVPNYIYVSEFLIDNSKSGIPINDDKITDVWVYVNNQSLAAYELPALVPIAEDGYRNITLRPGIKNAGQSSGRQPYPYYAATDTGINLVPGRIDTINPITYYDEDDRDITVVWEEQFENTVTPSWEIKPGSDTVLVISEAPEPVFLGDHSGAVYMDESGFQFELISPDLFGLPTTTIPIYLEINYLSSHDFVVGLYQNNRTEQFPIYVVKENTEWNKIYLDMTSFIQRAPLSSSFNISIGFQRKSTEPTVEMFLDNIKLIHY